MTMIEGLRESAETPEMSEMIGVNDVLGVGDLAVQLSAVAVEKSRFAPGVRSRCMGNHGNAKQTRKRFDQVRANDASYLNRRLRFLMVLATSAPLIGLLGTVVGMLQTFDGLSMEDSYKMNSIASGISQALVTTQTGLLVAIPALAFIHLLQRRKKAWLTCINRLESLSIRQVSSANNPS